jgi:predicted Zn-dependent protease
MIYQIAGIAEARNFDTVRPVFQTVVESFRPLSPDERKNIREKRLRLVKAKEGETVKDLTVRSQSAWKANQVAVANNLEESDRLREGQVMKITVEEPYAGKQQ